MDQLQYQTAYLAHLQADLAFRKQQEAATQLRHEETQAYGRKLLTQQFEHHHTNLDASAAATAAQHARAVAETKMAEAASEAARAQEAAAKIFAGDSIAQITELAISRINDRTGTTGTADIPRAVREVREAWNEAQRQLAG